MSLLTIQENFKVTLHKKLIEANFGEPLTIQEQRLLYAVISNVPAPEFLKENGKYVLDGNGKKIIKNKIDTLPPFEVPLKELAHAIGIKEMEYDSIKNLSRKFMGKIIEIETLEGDFEHIQWVFSSSYLAGTGMIKLEISPKLYPYILNLTDNFASVNFGSLLKFKCKYSSRLYFLVEQWGKVSSKEFTPDELRGILGVPYEMVKGERVYKLGNYPHFKQRALQPAINEVNKYTNYDISIVEVNRGRKVIGVQFKVATKKVITIPDQPKAQKMPEPLKVPETIYDEIAQSISHLNFNKEAYTNIAKRLMGIENIESIKDHVIKELNRLAAYIEESGNLGAGFAIKEVEKAVMRFTVEQNFNFNDLIEGTKPKANVRPQGKNKELVPDWFYEQKQEQAAKQPAETPVTTGEMDFEAERAKILAMLGKTAN